MEETGGLTWIAPEKTAPILTLSEDFAGSLPIEELGPIAFVALEDAWLAGHVEEEFAGARPLEETGNVALVRLEEPWLTVSVVVRMSVVFGLSDTVIALAPPLNVPLKGCRLRLFMVPPWICRVPPLTVTGLPTAPRLLSTLTPSVPPPPMIVPPV